jgi:hypothetical protein
MSERVGRPTPRFRGMACAGGRIERCLNAGSLSRPPAFTSPQSRPLESGWEGAMRALVMLCASSNIDQITPSLNAASVGCRGSLELSRDK